MDNKFGVEQPEGDEDLTKEKVRAATTGRGGEGAEGRVSSVLCFSHQPTFWLLNLLGHSLGDQAVPHFAITFTVAFH